MKYYTTQGPYRVVPHAGIQYGVCCAYDHISRYKGLRQVIRNYQDIDSRFIALETPNAFTTSVEVDYYEVSEQEENRLDLIAYKLLGSSQYSWVLAYFNKIEDGFTVHAGQKLIYPTSFTSLFNKGEILGSISPLQLNLGTE